MECYEILNSEYNMTIAPINPWQPWLPAQALKTNTQKDTTVGSALVDNKNGRVEVGDEKEREKGAKYDHHASHDSVKISIINPSRLL